MLRRLADFLRPGAPAFLVGASLLLLMVVSLWLPAFSITDVLDLTKPLFDRYGLAVTALAYFVEGLFVLNFYWPGSLVVFLTVMVLPKDLGTLIAEWLVINAAALLSIIVNVMIGRFGFHRALLALWSKDQFTAFAAWAKRRGSIGLLLVGIHINWLSLATVALSSARTLSTFRIVGLAWLSHLCWSAIALAVISQLDISRADGNGSNIVVALGCFVVGFAMCCWSAFRSQNGTTNRRLTGAFK